MRVRVEGLDELRKSLKKIDTEYGKRIRQIHLKVAELVHERAEAATPRHTAKKALKPKATQSTAALVVKPRRGDELAVFLGQKRRSGWYGARRYRTSNARQFKPWVGNQWDPGETGAQPYFIGGAINQSVDEIIDIYGNELEGLLDDAAS